MRFHRVAELRSRFGKTALGEGGVGPQATWQGSSRTRRAHSWPSACSAEGRRSFPVTRTTTIWDNSRDTPVTWNATLRDIIEERASWVPGGERERTPSLQLFRMALAVAWLSVSLRARQPECPGPPATLHQEGCLEAVCLRSVSNGVLRVLLQDGASWSLRRCPSLTFPVVDR